MVSVATETVTVLQHASEGQRSHERRLESVGGSQGTLPCPPSQPLPMPSQCLCFGLLKDFFKVDFAAVVTVTSV